MLLDFALTCHLSVLSQAADVFGADVKKHEQTEIDARIKRDSHEHVIGVQADGGSDASQPVPRQPGIFGAEN